MEIQYQQPNERLTYELDLSARLSAGITVSSASCSAINATTLAADNSVLLSTTCSVTSPKVYFTARNVLENYRYKVTVLATCSNGDILEEDILIEGRAL